MDARFTRGDDSTLTLTVDPVAASWPAILTVKRNPDDPAPILSIPATVGVDGTATFLLPHTVMVMPPRTYTADIQFTAPDGRIVSMIPDGNEPADPKFGFVVVADVGRESDVTR